MTDNTDKLFLPTKNDLTYYDLATSTCSISPEETINILLKKEDFPRRMEHILRFSRVFHAGWKEEEYNRKTLEATIKRKDEYIAKLLNKIALLYIALPEK